MARAGGQAAGVCTYFEIIYILFLCFFFRRRQEATRERSSLSSELLGLKEDIEALGLRKKLVTDQVRQMKSAVPTQSAVVVASGLQQ